MNLRLMSVLLGALVAQNGPTRGQTGSYSVTDIGVVSGSKYSYPKAINDASGTIRVVGWSGSGYHGFYWDATKGIVDLGSLLSGGTSSGEAVNSAGEVVGWSGNSGGNNRVAIYRNVGAGGALAQLPYPALTYDDSGPFANGLVVSSSAGWINESRVVSGSVYRQDLGVFPVYWLQDGTGGAWQCHYFPQLPGSLPTNSGAGPAINDRGDVAGSVGSPTTEIGSGFRAVFWQNLGSPAAPVYTTPVDSGLGSEAGCGFINSASVSSGGYGESGGRFIWPQGSPIVSFTAGYLNGLSDPNGAGLTGATGRYYNANNAARAYIADSAGAFLDLGILSGGSASHGNGIAAVGGSFQVVGWANVKGGTNHAFVWTGTIKDLNSLTTGLGTFSSLSIGDRITNFGNITGEGLVKGGYTHACLLKKQ